MDIAIITLREALVADERSPSGFTWRERPLHHFQNSSAHAIWNARHAHTPAGSPDTSSGVFMIDIGGHRAAAYRIAFALRTGRWPIGSQRRQASPPGLPPASPA